MKIVAVFSLILAMATSYPVVRTWTMSQLSSEINAKTDPALLPYLKEALNRIMTAMFVSETKVCNILIYFSIDCIKRISFFL